MANEKIERSVVTMDNVIGYEPYTCKEEEREEMRTNNQKSQL